MTQFSLIFESSVPRPAAHLEWGGSEREQEEQEQENYIALAVKDVFQFSFMLNSLPLI